MFGDEFSADAGLRHVHQLLGKARSHLHDISMAETRADAENAFDFFVEAYGAKYDKGGRVPDQRPGSSHPVNFYCFGM